MMPPTSSFEVRISGKDEIADGVMLLTLRSPEGAPLPTWEPGAHIDLLLAEGLVRQYSLCGDPADSSCYKVAVLREATGRGGSRFIHDELVVGQTVAAGGPRNHFALVGSQRYVFVAGGIGITPMLPMIAEAHAHGAQWRLVYGGRTRRSMAFRELLTAEHPDRVLVHPQDEHGLLDLAELLTGTTVPTTVYCCGPEPLLRAIEDVCADESLVDLHIERFAPKNIEDAGATSSFEVELARSGQTLSVGPDDALIDVLEDAGITVGGSCFEGTCGSCETTVLEGLPDHRDSVLTDDEQKAGKSMMVCVSRARSPRLVLDL